jgi:hypothetical protein
MKTVKLQNSNKVALVDDDDYDIVIKYHWWEVEGKYTTYARTYIFPGNYSLRMHRLILGITDETIKIDHKNRTGLDCRKQNLRIATDSQNQANRGPNRNNTSGYKGVCFHKRVKKFQASIQQNRKIVYIGYFSTAEKAAKAYDTKATELFGEFARLNNVV